MTRHLTLELLAVRMGPFIEELIFHAGLQGQDMDSSAGVRDHIKPPLKP